jgi:hypothetical protein
MASPPCLISRNSIPVGSKVIGGGDRPTDRRVISNLIVSLVLYDFEYLIGFEDHLWPVHILWQDAVTAVYCAVDYAVSV